MPALAPRVFDRAAPAACAAPPTLVPSEAPPLPPHYVERSDLLKGAVDVLANTNTGGDGSFYVLLGRSASGKSTLASAVVRDLKTRSAFRGGIFWVNLGKAGSSAVSTTRTTVATRGRAGSGWSTAAAGARATAEWGKEAAGAGGLAEGEGGGQLRALLRVLLARLCGADPFPVPPSANGDVAGDIYEGSRLSASAGEAARQLASMNKEAFLRRGRRLLVLDDFGGVGGAHDGLNDSLAELKRAGFALLVVCTEPGVLSLLRGRWTMMAASQPPTTTASRPRPPTFAPSSRRRSGIGGRQQRRPSAGTAYFSVLRTVENFDAMDMLLTRAHQGRDATAAVEAGEGRTDHDDDDVWAANAAAMKCAVEVSFCLVVVAKVLLWRESLLREQRPVA